MKLLYAVSLAALVFETTTTFAADIPVAETSFKASAPVSDWTGFYLGAGLGFRSTTTNANVNSAIDTTRGPVLQDRFLASNCYIGFPCITGRPYNTESYRFSPYFGYNWQANSHWVLGVEADFAFDSAALLAAHLAFMAAASCARRSGEILSLRFAFLAVPGFFALAVGAGDFFLTDDGLVAGRAAVARAADFLAAFIFFAASAACSFCLSLVSFFGPSCRRFSSRWIFFFKFFSFMMCPPARHEGELTI